MADIIHDGYDMPTDINHESRNWWGLSNVHFVMAGLGVAMLYGWYMACISLGLAVQSQIFLNGAVVIVSVTAATIKLNLDKWVIRVVRWCFQPYQVAHDDKKVTELSGIADIHGDYYLSTSGKFVALLDLTATGNDRIDPEQQETVLSSDRDFLNSLPCPIQIVGRTFPYDIGDYIAKRLKNSDRLSPKAHAMKMDHLQHIKNYIVNKKIRDKIELIVISVDSDRSRPLDELNNNVDIIVRNLATSGVIGRRLHSSEIAAVGIMFTTGFGKSGIDYLSLYMDVDRE